MLRTATTLRRAAVATMLVGLMALTGCSKGNGKSASPATSVDAQHPMSTDRPVDTKFTGADSAAFCTFARTYNDRSSAVAPTATADQLRSLYQDALASINQAVAVAPPEIKANVQVIAAAFGDLLKELNRVNFDLVKVSPAAFAGLQAPEFQAATKRFQAYTRTVCSIG